MKTNLAHRITFAAAALAAAACQQLPTLDQKPTAAAPQITEAVLRGRATEQLAAGVKQYESGDYDNALKNLAGSLEHGMLSKAEQARARKYMAFSHCVSGREVPCRDEFRRAFEIFPDFALSSAEDGHPSWGPVYRNVRTQLIAEREAAVKKPLIPLAKSDQMLSDGIVKYDGGDYPAAYTLLESAMKEGLKGRENQVKAIKHMAFSLCLQNKITQCRAEFTRIFSVDPAFDLAPAEAGHPSWAATFARAKAQAKKDLAAREKAAAPPTASVPKKN